MTIARIASVAGVVFAHAPVGSCSWGPDQKGNCRVLESVGLLITLCNVQLHSEIAKSTPSSSACGSYLFVTLSQYPSIRFFKITYLLDESLAIIVLII